MKIAFYGFYHYTLEIKNRIQKPKYEEINMKIQINNLDDHTYKQLKLIAEKDAITIKEVIIAALKNYVIEKELEYKRELINFEEDDGYQQPDQ